MNRNFSFGHDIIIENGRKINIYRVLYKNECIAFFRESTLNVNVTYQDLAEEYITTYGYMAEFRRRWNTGDRINWTEELRVL